MSKHCLRVFLFGLLASAVSGCFNISEELWLQPDQSGRYELTVEAGGSALGALLRVAYRQTDDSLLATGQPPVFADTLIRLSDLPAAVKKQLPHPEALVRTTVRIALKEGMQYRFTYDFDHLEHLPHFWANIRTMNELQEQDSTVRRAGWLKIPLIGDIQRVFGGLPQMRWDGRKFTRMILIDNTDSQALEGNFDENKMPAAVRAMLKNKTYRLALHLPQMVRGVKGKGFKFAENDVTAEFSLSEVLRNRYLLACEVDLK